jgi:hypothetical protein
MGDASKSEGGSGLRQALRLGHWAFGLPGLALVWPVAGTLVCGGKGARLEAFWIDLGPSLALIAAPGILFIQTARR